MARSLILLESLAAMREVMIDGQADAETLSAWEELAATVRLCLSDDVPELAHHTATEREAAARELIVEFIDEWFPVQTVH